MDSQRLNVCIYFSVNLTHDQNTLVQQFSEHYHDAWAAKKLDGGWTYSDQWSGPEEGRTHPRLKPYNMLSEFVSIDKIITDHKEI